MQTDVVSQKHKRQLRLRIGRLRRRIDGRATAVGRESRRLVSWKTHVRRHPVHALLAAIGVGMLFGAASRGAGSKILRFIGRQLAFGGLGHIGVALRGELARVWEASSPREQREDPGGANDG